MNQSTSFGEQLGSKSAQANHCCVICDSAAHLQTLVRKLSADVAAVLERSGYGVLLVVTDNGRGMTPAMQHKDGCLGILGMHECALALGGSVEVTSTPGQGVKVKAWVPITANEPAAPTT